MWIVRFTIAINLEIQYTKVGKSVRIQGLVIGEPDGLRFPVTVYRLRRAGAYCRITL